MGVLFSSSANQDRLLLQIGELFEKEKALTTFTSLEEILDTVEVPYSVQYIQTDSLPLGYKELLQVGQKGKKQLIYHLWKQGLSLVEARLVGESLLVSPQQMIYLIGTKKLDNQMSPSSGLLSQKVNGVKTVENEVHSKESAVLLSVDVKKPVQKESDRGLSPEQLPETGDKSTWQSTTAMMLGLSSIMLGLAKVKKRLFKS